MAAAARSATLFFISSIQRLVDILLIAVMVGCLALFGLQFPHSSRLDTLWLIERLHEFVDPLLSTCASWLDMSWPATSTSYIPLGSAFAMWLVKIGVDAGLLRGHRAIRKAMPTKEGAVAGPADPMAELAALEVRGEATDSEEYRASLLKRYRQIEGALKDAKRKRCAFLSIDIVGSAQMKVGEGETEIAATFQAYEELLKKTFEHHAAWKQAWTPDGVMICFLEHDLAVAAAQQILQSLKKFNEDNNKLRTKFRIRCGVNAGDVAIFEDSKLEKVADRVVDVAGHMQKQANTDALWLSAEIFNSLSDKSGFQAAGVEVDGYNVYEWATEPRPVAAPAAKRSTTRTLSGVSGVGVPIQRIGRYEIANELGRGAMGAVYKARDPQIGRTVAIKVILTANLTEEELESYKKRFYREAQTAGQLSHPNIVTIYDVAEDDDGQPYLVMEFIEGTPLEKLLSKGGGQDAGSRLTLKESIEIGAQVADALDYAHRRGVIHRDIKPANILMSQEGKAKIADFGIAKVVGTHMTQAGLIVGTPAFMAPEQFVGGKVDGRSDLFSLGVMLYWMVTSQKPFAGETITEIAFKVVHGVPSPARQVKPDLPASLEAILSRCLAKNADDRYPTAGELANDLQALKASQTLIAAAPPPASGAKT